MINILAVVLAAAIIPTSPSNAVMQQNYSEVHEPTYYSSPSTVKTPNGTDVNVRYEDNGSWDDINTNNARFADTFYDLGIYIQQKDFGGYSFNNFAYAFYIYPAYQYAPEKCIMDDFSPYIDDGSCYNVSEPQVGDIALYFAGGAAIHAGIVTNVYGTATTSLGDNVMVQSKWFDYGVFEHRGDACPYTYKYSHYFGILVDSNGNTTDGADHIAYYRMHTHNYKAVPGSSNGNFHTGICDECGYTKSVKHEFMCKSIDANQHFGSCSCGYTETVNHTWRMVGTVAGRGQVKCIFCGHFRILGKDEFVPVVPWE